MKDAIANISELFEDSFADASHATQLIIQNGILLFAALAVAGVAFYAAT